MRKFLGFKEPVPEYLPSPRRNTITKKKLDSKELTKKDLKPFIKKVYYKHFLQYLKTKQPQLNSDDAWLKIKSSVDNYVDETMDSIADAINSYIYWMESDIEDYADGMFEAWESGNVKSVRDPDFWGEDSCPCKKTHETENSDWWPTSAVRKEDEEELVDWKDADKAW